MIDFIIKLEDMLRISDSDNWEIIYCPERQGYILKIDETAVFMTKVDTAYGLKGENHD